MITLQKGRYEALEPLGSGATSRVEKARDNVIGRTVALKTFINGFGEGQEQQFLREAQIIGQLSNPAIVQLYDVGIDEQGTPFLVMEYIRRSGRRARDCPSRWNPSRRRQTRKHPRHAGKQGKAWRLRHCTLCQSGLRLRPLDGDARLPRARTN